MITFVLTVFGDLVIAVNIGVLLAALLFMKRASEAVTVGIQSQESLREEVANGDFSLRPGTVVCALEGPYFFAAAERLESTLEQVHSHADTLVLRLGRVPFIDATGMQSLADLVALCHRKGTRLVLTEARPNVLEKLRRAGLVSAVGEANVLGHIRDLGQQVESQP